MSMRKTSLLVVGLLIVAGSFLASPTTASAQGSSLGSNSGCPAGSTPRAISGTLGRYECVGANGAVTGQTDFAGFISNTTSCEGVKFWTSLGTCAGRLVAVWSGGLIVATAGWVLELAGVLLNASLELTTIGFDSQIYAKVQGGIEAVWTAFRDIANIVIIGMFTFIALTMILGLEKFNARQMVARVLVIAVLINFSLLFTRVIIASSNFVATQFYKAAQFNSEGAQLSVTGQATPYDKFSTGISGKFGQMLGVAGVFDTKDALWKVTEKSDNGFTALLMGILSAVVFLAVALLFLYASFLLIARAILFIFLLITSSLAFASYLIPNGGGFGGYGWSSWWSSLLKNAVFAPLLLILIWATIQLGQGIKVTNGSLGGLLADPSKGGHINALFSYLLILGMLYASIKIASTFASKIGGFDYAALAPAFGAGVLGRMGGFLGRQTLGRAGANISGRFAERAQAAEKGSSAQKLYNFGAQRFAGAAKRDFNLMRSQLGSEIQGTARVKNLDTIAGKALGGFQGVQDKFKKDMAESAKNLAYTDEQKKGKIKKELEAKMKSDPTFKAAYDKSEKDHEVAKEQLEDARKEAAIETGNITNKYKTKIEKLEQDRLAAETAYNSGAGSKSARDDARKSLKESVEEQKLAMNIEANKIKRAEAVVNRAAQEFENLSASVIDAAVKANKLPEKFASAGEIAEATIKNSFTSLLRASMPTPKGVEKLAEKVGKEAGKPKVPKDETVKLARQVAREKLADDKPKTP